MLLRLPSRLGVGWVERVRVGQIQTRYWTDTTLAHPFLQISQIRDIMQPDRGDFRFI